jgi:hypothetical protein
VSGGVGGIVLRAEGVPLTNHMRVTVRHVCGHQGSYVVHTSEQAQKCANRPCEACAPAAEEQP